MAVQTLTTENMAASTKSTDVVTGANMTSVATTDTFTYTPPANRTEDLAFIIAFGTTATVTFNAGTIPPGSRSGLGALAITGTTSEVRIVPIDYSRHAGAAGAITGSVAGNTSKIGVFRMPRTI